VFRDDKLHGQIDGEPNGVELHPVLRVEAIRGGERSEKKPQGK
jgi:hypothetical protein